MVVVYIMAAILLLLVVSGAYVFIVASVRRKEFPWLDKEKLEKTPFGRFYDRITEADRWLKEKDAKSVYITSADGLKLHGVWVPAENPKGTVLLLHGYSSTKLLDFGAAMPYYHESGFNLLIPDQRSHGKSEGRYITFGVRECGDVLRWVDFHNQNYGEQKIILCGMSMGAATVMYAAGEELPDNVKGVIADCGYTSPKEIISTVFKRTVHFPPGPVMWFADIFARVFGGFSFYGKDTRKTLKNNRLPILILHGTKDSFVPYEMSVESHEACAGPKRLLLVEGADHCVSILVNRKLYTETVEDFMLECL